MPAIFLDILYGLFHFFFGLFLLLAYIMYVFRVAIWFDERTRLPGWACLGLGILLAPLALITDI